jgi:transposase-like protein
MLSFLGPLERLELVRDGFYSPDRRQHTRAAALLALDRGHTISYVARSVKCHRHTINRWLARYLEIRAPAALQDGRAREARRVSARLRPARASRLVALAAATGLDPAAPGRLDLDARQRARLAHLAAKAPDVSRRYWAAMLWAFDRGGAVSTIARAAGCHRDVVYEAPKRHLARVLDG